MKEKTKFKLKINKEIMYIMVNLIPLLLFIAGGIFVNLALFELGKFYGYLGIGALFIMLAYLFDNFLAKEGEINER